MALNGIPTLEVDYDLIGNIIEKSDVSAGSWSYHASKKHALTATGAGGPTLGYDANGNVSSKSGASISWTSFNAPSVINGAGGSSQFWYGPDRQRIRQQATYGGGSETTHYLGGLFEKRVTGSNTHHSHLIVAPTGLIASHVRRAAGSPEDTFYLTRDHLGSVDSVTNAAASVQVRLAYDAFGRRRNEAGWSGAVPAPDWSAIANTTRRGYTAHEHLDHLGLTHMNGRVQDPLVGRFLSADPFVTDPTLGQSLNRFSYVRNNPLTLIDPSGFDATEQHCTQACLGLSLGGYLWVTGGHITNRHAPPHSSRLPRTPRAREPSQPQWRSGVPVGQPTGAGIPWPDVIVSTVDGPSYLHRVGVTGRGIATGLFGAALGLIAATPDQALFYDFGSALYDDPELADDFQAGHNFGYVLGLGSLITGAKAGSRPIAAGEVTATRQLIPTHMPTLSRRQYQALREDIARNGILDPIKYVEFNGRKYIVDGHHRLRAARELGIERVPTQQVQLPYGGYRTTGDLFEGLYY